MPIPGEWTSATFVQVRLPAIPMHREYRLWRLYQRNGDMKLADGAPEIADPMRLLEELDVRQNEVIDQLDDLNARIEKLLQECSTTRSHQDTTFERKAA